MCNYNWLEFYSKYMKYKGVKLIPKAKGRYTFRKK